MKTTLPVSIKTVEEAKAFLTALHANGEAYHPEDDAHRVDWHATEVITNGDCEQLNRLMKDIYNLPGNDGRHCERMIFDPCEFVTDLNDAQQDGFELLSNIEYCLSDQLTDDFKANPDIVNIMRQIKLVLEFNGKKSNQWGFNVVAEGEKP